MSFLILMRHGRSLRNDGLPSCERDNVLTAQGAAKVLKESAILSRYDIRHVVASTVLRAQLTALLAVGAIGRGMPVAQIEGIEEIRPVDPDEQAPHETDEEMSAWKRDIDIQPGWALETQRDVYVRTVRAVTDRVLPLLASGSVLLVSHYFPIRAIRAHIDHGRAEAMPGYRPANAEPVVYKRDQVLRAFGSTGDPAATAA